jgi:hypothetical protein
MPKAHTTKLKLCAQAGASTDFDFQSQNIPLTSPKVLGNIVRQVPDNLVVVVSTTEKCCYRFTSYSNKTAN